MPEFPEVYTIVTDLQKHLTNLTITKVEEIAGYKIKLDEGIIDLEHLIVGKHIKEIAQHGKNIFFELDTVFIVFHLAMTGKLLIRKPEYTGDRHVRAVFTLTKKDVDVELRFCDVRMFGKVQILTKSTSKKMVNKLGPNPLSPNLSVENFYSIIKSKKTNIKNLLLDQEKIAGLGNVYASDALWIAKIHPLRQTASITKDEARVLLAACREILTEGIANRGLTISDYVDAFGKPGNQQNYFRIYRQEKCTHCGGNVTNIVVNTRTTYLCSTCQK